MNKRENKKRIKDICVLMLAIFTCLLKGNYVFAEENAITYTMKYIGDYYMVSDFDSGIIFSHFRVYSFNDKISYGIDVDYKVVTWNYHYKNDYLSLGLTQEQMDYIQLIGYYGYQYPSHQNNILYFMAAQELILDYLLDIDVYWTDKYDAKAEALDLSSYENEILELISRHSVLPSFNYSDNYYAVGEEIQVVDNNLVLSDYEIIDSDGLVAEISDNRLIIQNDGSNVGNYTVILKRKSYINDPLYLYYADASQTLFTPGKIEEVECEVNIRIDGAILTVHRYDSNNNIFISNSEYGLYDSDNNLVSTFLFGEDGQAIVENLPFGTYVLKKLYDDDQENEIVYSINVDKEEVEFSIYEDIVTKKLELFKTYGDGNFVESDCVFDIIDSNGDIYTTITTDDYGYASVMLPYGEYIISQKSTMNDYEKINDFEVVIDSSSNDVITYYLHSNSFISNPKTYDGIIKNIIFVSICIISLIANCIYIFKKNML